MRRIDVDKVIDASQQVLLSTEDKCEFLDKKFKAGETEFNADEYEIAKTVTEERIAKDLAEGKVSKYILKLIDDPKVLTYWDQTKFDNLKRSEEYMKQLRKQVIQRRRAKALKRKINEGKEVEVFVEDRSSPNNESKIGNSSLMTTNHHEMIAEVDEDEPFTKSELDEIE